MAITDFLERGRLINPDGPCVIMDDQQYTYNQMTRLMNRIANGLLSLGLGRGQNGAILSDNDPEGYACTLGIMRAGLAYIPMDSRNSAEDNQRILDWGDAEVLFYGRRFHEQIKEIKTGLPNLRHLICIDRPMDGVPGLADWVDSFPDRPPPVEIPADSISWLQTGSGTSGDFKMAMITHRAYHAFVSHNLISTPDPHPVMLAAAPITHAAGGLSYHVLALGGTLVLIDKPDPQAVLASIEKFKITKLFLPPTVIYRLLDQPNVRDFDYRSLKYLVYSASPMSVEKLRLALDVFGPVMAQGYGQTEALGIASMSPEDHLVDGRPAPEARLSACGRPALPFCRVVIVDDENRALPDGAVGEICVRGDQVMKGYYRNPLATARTIVDGWCHTGDVGFFDDEGYLHISDRKKDMIITGGFNVFPAEIEQVISSLDGVTECAVIGVPHDDWGEAVKAVVELTPGKSVSAEEVIALCRKRLGGVKTPKTVDFVTELPRSARGKVLKRVLRDEHWKGRARLV